MTLFAEFVDGFVTRKQILWLFQTEPTDLRCVCRCAASTRRNSWGCDSAYYKNLPRFIEQNTGIVPPERLELVEIALALHSLEHSL